MTHHPGRFITIEGVDGVGKSTQIRLLSDNLNKLGIEHHITREPGGCEEAEAIRSLFLEETFSWNAISQLFLMMAARSQHVSQVIRPALESGKWVICDRFLDSTIVYQGILGQIPTEQISDLNSIATVGLDPDKTVLLRMDAKLGYERLQARHEEQNAFDQKGFETYQRLKDAFDQRALENSERIIAVNANQNKEKVQTDIMQGLGLV